MCKKIGISFLLKFSGSNLPKTTDYQKEIVIKLAS